MGTSASKSNTLRVLMMTSCNAVSSPFYLRNILAPCSIGRMDDIVTREGFLRWLANGHNERMDGISQEPRSLDAWTRDYARAMRGTAGGVVDPGFGGIFGGGLHDIEVPDGDDF